MPDVKPKIIIVDMAELEMYKKIEEKNENFRSSPLIANNTINDIVTFNKWYKRYEKKVKDRSDKFQKEPYFFRGVADAKYKLYNSAQRIWITKDVENWNKKVSYQAFIRKFIDKAKEDKLLKRVFEYFDIAVSGQDFPILSILQHYGGPTPLMDWTLDIDVALFFAIAKISDQRSTPDIDNYFSIYIIDNQRSKIRSIASIADSDYRSLEYVTSGLNLKETVTKNLFYLSDYQRTSAKNLKRGKPLTTIYNQNIIPQKGLFIFNPLPDIPLENYFHKGDKENPPFRCFNVKKDLAEYIKRKIATKGITKSLIYPDVNDNTNNIFQEALNSYFKL